MNSRSYLNLFIVYVAFAALVSACVPPRASRRMQETEPAAHHHVAAPQTSAPAKDEPAAQKMEVAAPKPEKKAEMAPEHAAPAPSAWLQGQKLDLEAIRYGEIAIIDPVMVKGSAGAAPGTARYELKMNLNALILTPASLASLYVSVERKPWAAVAPEVVSVDVTGELTDATVEGRKEFGNRAAIKIRASKADRVGQAKMKVSIVLDIPPSYEMADIRFYRTMSKADGSVIASGELTDAGKRASAIVRLFEEEQKRMGDAADTRVIGWYAETDCGGTPAARVTGHPCFVSKDAWLAMKQRMQGIAETNIDVVSLKLPPSVASGTKADVKAKEPEHEPVAAPVEPKVEKQEQVQVPAAESSHGSKSAVTEKPKPAKPQAAKPKKEKKLVFDPVSGTFKEE